MTNLKLPELQLRGLTEIWELREVEQLQKDVWGVADIEVFPALALKPMIELGSILIGAFENEKMAGFVFGFPGLKHGKTILHSDMLAVRPDYRRHGLGYRLKLAQRQQAMLQGIDTITWTFDPLQGRNARLNFGKLGVLSDSYRPNYYGETSSFLHQSGTDRLWVRWELDSERVCQRVDGKRESRSEAKTILRVGEAGAPISTTPDFSSEAALAVEIPVDINRLLEHDVPAALKWRAATRQIFISMFARGYCATEFDFVEGEFGPVGRYLLTKKY